MGSENSRQNITGMSSTGSDSEPSQTRNFDSWTDDDDSELPSIVEYLIRSGQIRFISSNNEDSESSEEGSDCDMTSPSKGLPSQPNRSGNLQNIKESDIYMSVLQSSGRASNTYWTEYMRPVLPNLLSKRQMGLNKQKQFSNGDKVIFNSKYLPSRMTKLAHYAHKAFCGTYSENGNVFLSACQDQHIRLYDTTNDEFRLLKSIRARDVGWSVLDTAFSPDGRYAAYVSWSDCIHLCSLYGDHDCHEALYLEPGDHSFCIFSLKFSSDNKEILGGANDGHLYVYDRAANKRTLRIKAHDDDINAVMFADESSDILYSGGDDGLCKVWDRRTLRESHPEPVGTMSGHQDGITYIDSKNDARFFISNSKDQTLKLWDVRKFSSETGVNETKKVVSAQRWDYRWQQVPKKVTKRKQLKGDSSVMTYTGHCILHTLIRCKFSPEHSTGQRYIYTGCASGSILIFDLLTGNVVKRLDGHNSCVRDVSWHPFQNKIISTSWDCSLGLWSYCDSNLSDAEIKFSSTCPVTRSTKRRSRPNHIQEVAMPGLFD